ncbi:MAG TPA: hypothetical protein GXZ65_07205 [Clostridiales bacterium]|jgi:hypothetical protein|nr:hypothetical protein [Clostridiales bacterium]
MSVDSRYLIDFQKRVIKGISGYSAERGYVTGAFPFIPELYLQNSTFIPMATEEVDKIGMMGDELYRHLYVSFFGGIIGTFFWYYARDTLMTKGLYAMCKELKPIKELDELAYGLMGMTVAEGEYEFKELFYEIYNYVVWELEEAAREYDEETIDRLKNILIKIFFHTGMWLALAKLGDLVKDN